MPDASPPPASQLSPRAQAILERVEREAQRAGGDGPAAASQPPPPADPTHGLARPRPGEAAVVPAAAAGPAPAPDDADAVTTDHLLALVNALAQRTEVARRQLEELTAALDLVTRGLSPPEGPAGGAPAPSAPPAAPVARRAYEAAPPPSVRWPSPPR